MKKQNKLGNRLKTAGVCLGVVVSSTAALQADSGATDDGKVSKLEQDNKDLKKRLDALEALAQKEGLLPSGQKPNATLSFLAGSQLSGFVTASYFYDTSRPPGAVSPGYLWNYKANSFDINKIKVTLGKAAEISGEKWDAGYEKTAYFLDWIENRYGEGTIRELNGWMQDKKYHRCVFKELTGRPVRKLWSMYCKNLEEPECIFVQQDLHSVA